MLPDGLYYLPEYFSLAEIEELVEHVDRQPWMDSLKRRVQHYGYIYDYRRRLVDETMFIGQLPEWLARLSRRLYDNQLSDVLADQVIVNEYHPGQGIAPHIDCEPCFGDTIISITLGGHCVMNFSHVETGEEVQVLLESGSLIRMVGEARYQWKHGVSPRKYDVIGGQKVKRTRRISLTFRNVIITNTDS